MAVKKEHIVNIHGKDFVKFEGLLDVAHSIGIQGMETEFLPELSNHEKQSYTFRAIVTDKDGRVFKATGDASLQNVDKMVSRHVMRVAETRAIARALRFLTNIGMASVEELGGDDVEVIQDRPNQGQDRQRPNVPKPSTAPETDNVSYLEKKLSQSLAQAMKAKLHAVADQKGVSDWLPRGIKKYYQKTEDELSVEEMEDLIAKIQESA